MKPTVITLIVLALLIVWDLTFVRWKGDGLAELEELPRVVAETFLADVEGLCLDDSPVRGLIRHRHVSVGAEFHRCDPLPERQGAITGRVDEPPHSVVSEQLSFGSPYTVWVDFYTVLGLPLTRMRQEACTVMVACESGQPVGPETYRDYPGLSFLRPGGTAHEDWADLHDPQWGRAGLARERLPHPACAWCFTVPGGHNPYQIYEYVVGDGPEAVILRRDLPNPAPSPISRPTMTSDGEPIYYIGTRAIIGPTDDAPYSADLPIPYIELRRIQVRHHHTLWAIPGVHGMGVGADGFVIDLLPDHADSRARIPSTLEGVPVTVRIRELAVFFGGAGGGQNGAQ